MRRDLRKQEMSVAAPQLPDSAALKSRAGIEVTSMIAPRANGLAAWFMRMPPNATAEAPAHPGGGGRFYVVAGGAMIVSGEPKPRLAAIWTSDDEAPLLLAAEAKGLDVLVLQFPAEALSA
jgi:redox-sensitive bicupin YhaK (pirin superfamily)